MLVVWMSWMLAACSDDCVHYQDVDGDGFGDDSTGVVVCDPGSGYAKTGGDCDDSQVEVYPGALEVCDGMDNSCNGLVDDADPQLDPAQATPLFVDTDGDGFGSGSSTPGCEAPSGFVSVDGDCDDGDDAVNPGETELSYNGIDDDCIAETPDDDLDGDGFELAEDCDDTDAQVGGPEVPYDGVDNDCHSGTPDDDLDGDGYGIDVDCDDGDSTVNPGRSERARDGIDNDCSYLTPDDGFAQVACGYKSACAIDVEGELHCWGDSSSGLESPPSGKFEQVGLSQLSACAVSTKGAVECWGSDQVGTLTNIPNLSNVQDLAVSSLHTCVLDESGELSCWGDSRRYPSSLPVGPFRDAAAWGPYGDIVCVSDEVQELSCWGAEDWFSSSSVGRLSSVAIGSSAICGIDESSAVLCWAESSTKKLLNTPTGEFQRISIGQSYGIGVTLDGDLVHWGSSGNDVNDIPTGIGRAISISAGNSAACVIDEYGDLHCWGHGDVAQDSP